MLECLLLALQADRPLPLLEFGLHAASRYAFFDEQAGTNAANFVFPALLLAAEAAACAQLLAITEKSGGHVPSRILLWIPPGFIWLSPTSASCSGFRFRFGGAAGVGASQRSDAAAQLVLEGLRPCC